MAEDFYTLLGVARTASAEDVKKAYRRLARKYHPDVNPGDTAAEERFKRVSAAFEVLSDPSKRKLYDEFGEDAAKLGWDEQKAEQLRRYRAAGAAAGGGGGMPFGGGAGFDVGDLFSEIFGGGAGAAGFDVDEVLGGAGRRGRGGPAGPARGEDLTTRVGITLAEAVGGTERVLSVQRPGRCSGCAGAGTRGAPTTCATCGGSGRARRGMGMLNMAMACPTCGGSGRAAPPCPVCGGSGLEEQAQRLTVKIPAGVSTGSRVRLAGQGAAGPRGGPPGDLYIETEVAPHPLVRREGDDLYMDLPLTVGEALLGGEVRVPTFGGPVTVSVPAGSQSGRKMRLKGRGVPSLKGGAPGDLYLTLQVKVPEDAGAEVRRAAEALARGYRADVREGLVL